MAREKLTGEDCWFLRCLRWQMSISANRLAQAWGVDCTTVCRRTDAEVRARRDRRTAAWCKAHPERRCEINAAYRSAHPERVRQSNEAYRNAYPERRRQSVRAWEKANPGYVRERFRRYRARLLAAGGAGFPVELEAEFFEAWGGACAYCGCGAPPLEVDHIRPLLLGGSHDLYNHAPACRRCNASKNANLLESWRPDLAEFVPARAAWVAAALYR